MILHALIVVVAILYALIVVSAVGLMLGKQLWP